MAYTKPPRRPALINAFSKMRIKLASPDRILEWSRGEVTKPETINYRTQRSEKHGLFDEKIFGAEKDYECYCGKYKGIRYKGIVCDKCGVELTRAIVRRERMGHIELCSPVAHIWFLRGLPSRMATVLGMNAGDLEKVVYFAGYLITKVHEDEKKRLLADLESEYKLKAKAAANDTERERLKDLALKARLEIDGIAVGRVLEEVEYHRFSVKYGGLFEAKIGAEAVFEILKKIDLDVLLSEMTTRYASAGAQEREKLEKRISLVRAMIRAGVRPEWMFLTRIPVIPPALRPMVALEGGRHASSDLNDLYRRVINRNNRLKKLLDIKAPEVILRNEKRILQEAVDALLDNSIRRSATPAGALNASQRRPLKSLADYLKGKQGYFRQNLLGKRVDYSGRSVIVVGPELEMDECGLPKHMALELFRPFVIAELMKRELAFNIRGAGRLIEDAIPEVWEILEEVTKGRYVLLNRAPTLHRQGIQAFRPVLIEGNAIQLHPMVCAAFNADFDGDQMAVHVPLSEEAQLEAREFIASSKNILKPGSGEVIVMSTKPLDIALGAYWLTKDVKGAKGEGKAFQSPNAAILAYDYGEVDIRAKIQVLPTPGKERYAAFAGERFETSVGRLLFNSVLPSDYPFVNYEITKKALSKLLEDFVERYGTDALPNVVDKVKKLGFSYATKAGVTWSMQDVVVPAKKREIVEGALSRVREIEGDYGNGFISSGEKTQMVTEVWHRAKQDVEREVEAVLDPMSPVADMVRSGARGSLGNLTQMAGMKGLITNPKGETIETPIISSMSEGLNPVEYFMSTHGSRKGLSDTALNTAKAGYLTRRLFDVAQDIVVSEKDCGTKQAVPLSRVSSSGVAVDFAKLVEGRYLAADATAKDGTVVAKKGTLLVPELARTVAASDVESVSVRSPRTCESGQGICQKCYGADLTTLAEIDLGEAVGTIAAQAIGEPGTQLTMRTFHAGGIAQVGGDITSGLPRVEELFDRRKPKTPAVIAKTGGTVIAVVEQGAEKSITVVPNLEEANKKKDNIVYSVPAIRVPLVREGQVIKKGELLTDGSADLSELFTLAGKEVTQEYIIREVTKIYELQGASVSRKHIEVIIKQMFSRVEITAAGDTIDLTVGDMLEKADFDALVRDAKERGAEPPKADSLVLGIKEASLTRKSFLSAASFEQTNKVLINAALRGTTDTLRGLKENVIIGRLIPAGTGFPGSRKYEKIKVLQEAKAKARAQALAAREAAEAAAVAAAEAAA